MAPIRWGGCPPKKGLLAERGIALEYVPRGCPELNPVGRFFEEVRKELANHVFNTIKGVERYLCTFLKKYWQHPETIVQLCHYPYMRTN